MAALDSLDGLAESNWRSLLAQPRAANADGEQYYLVEEEERWVHGTPAGWLTEALALDAARAGLAGLAAGHDGAAAADRLPGSAPQAAEQRRSPVPVAMCAAANASAARHGLQNTSPLPPPPAQPPARALHDARRGSDLDLALDDTRHGGHSVVVALRRPDDDGALAHAHHALDAPLPAAPHAPLPLSTMASAFALSQAPPADATAMAVDPSAADMGAPPPASESRVHAFARLRFDDGSYYMHTYQIVLGRNIALAHKDMRRLARVDQLHADGHAQQAEALLHGSARRHKKRRRSRRASRSVISERGGIVNAPIESMPLEYHQRRQSNAAHSLSHAHAQASPPHPNGHDADDTPAERAPQDVIMQAFPQYPAQADGHVPEDPNDCPLVPIHPQHITARAGAQGPKGISRQHAKIFFDFDHGNFCVQVLGSNGLHHEAKFLHQGQIVPLDHGDRMLIGAVNIQFYLPDNTLTDDQRLRQESGSRPMSFSFENGQGELESDNHISSESEGEQSINPRHVYHYPVDSDIDSDDMLDQGAHLDHYEEPISHAQPTQTLKLKIKAPPPAPVRETKRTQKRKYREPSPEEPPVKKTTKGRNKEPVKEPARDAKAAKEPKESKDKAKAPAKTPPAKAPLVDARGKENSAKEKAETSKAAAATDDGPPLLRKPYQGELEAGDVGGLITEELARAHNLPTAFIGHIMEKRKGPGRPPKDGLMSKRQKSMLVKQLKMMQGDGINPTDISMSAMKPKAPKRKESNVTDDNDDVMETTEKGHGPSSSSDRKQKPNKPPRTPSPEMRVDDYTEEQLQRPSANYVILIYEAISSSPTGQMNLQQIYNYIERNYPFYKFKVTTSGWQSSVRHNLGQHEAFIKADKEGKGYNWRIDPGVSIEKERRKRQISPPINHGQRQPYYQTPNGYPTYTQPAYPYHAGMPQTTMAGAPPRPPPSLNSTPRLPPSLTRDGNATAPSASQGTAPHASPYASPWAGGNGNGAASPPMGQASPYPPPSSSAAAPVSSAGPSGQYGVLYPTTAPMAQGGQQYATAGVSPYAQPPRSYAPYPASSPPSNASFATVPPAPPPQGAENALSHLAGRYPPNIHPGLIPQFEAFRRVYLESRTGPGEDKKVDNAIRACIDTTVPEASLTNDEKQLLKYLRGIKGVTDHLPHTTVPKKGNDDNNTDSGTQPATSTVIVAAGTAAAIAADAAKNPLMAQPPPPPQSQATNHANNAPTPSAQHPIDPSPSTHRPSVEPLTPLPGSPAMPPATATATLKREDTGRNADAAAVEQGNE